MNHHLRFALVAGLLFLVARSASAQSNIPDAWKVAPSLTAEQVETVKKTVKDNAARLASTDPDAMRAARLALMDDCRASGLKSLSPAFAAAYSEAANAEFLPLFAKTSGIRVKLNIAVAAAKVAENCRTAKLEPLAMKLLEPSQPEALKLWGVKTAKSVLPELTRLGGHAKLMDAVIAAVNAHPTAAMVRDAYEALASSPTPAGVKAVFPQITALLQKRLALYRTSLPEDPGADAVPLAFLSRQEVWGSALDAAQKQQVMQLVLDYLYYAAWHCDNGAAEIRPELQTSIKTLAEAIQVTGKVMQEDDLDKAAGQLARNSAMAVKVFPMAEPLYGIVVKIKGFTGIKKPAAPAPAANVTATP